MSLCLNINIQYQKSLCKYEFITKGVGQMPEYDVARITWTMQNRISNLEKQNRDSLFNCESFSTWVETTPVHPTQQQKYNFFPVPFYSSFTNLLPRKQNKQNL